jgi:hypothetical protein
MRAEGAEALLLHIVKDLDLPTRCADAALVGKEKRYVAAAALRATHTHTCDRASRCYRPSVRTGTMGYVLRIGMALRRSSPSLTKLHAALAAHPRWSAFCKDELDQRTKLDTTPLANAEPVLLLLLLLFACLMTFVLHCVVKRASGLPPPIPLGISDAPPPVPADVSNNDVCRPKQCHSSRCVCVQLSASAPAKPLRSGMSTADPRQLVRRRGSPCQPIVDVVAA